MKVSTLAVVCLVAGWTTQALAQEDPKSAMAAARTICYSALTGNQEHSLIMIPLPDNYTDLDALCHNEINGAWHAGGVAKAGYFSQDCGAGLDNNYYGGGYTSYVTEEYFESHRDLYPTCNETNAFVCCSPQLPN